MRATDIIVIYFACGSPLGVYYFTRIKDRPSFGSAFWTLLRFLAWPVSVAILLRHKYFAGRPSDEEILDRKINDIRSEMELIAFGGAPASSGFDFREVYTRFTGLAGELRNIPV